MSLEVKIQNLFLNKGLTLGLAESCTGGAIASRLTRVAGCSDYFVGGIVCYTIPIKQKLLKVTSESLTKHGVVSESVAKEMAQGTLNTLDCDIAVSVTGIAGPSGATECLSVGTVYIAVCDSAHVLCQQFIFDGERSQVIHSATQQALLLLETFVNNK